MLGWKRFTVHLVDKQYLIPGRVVDTQTALVILDLTAFHAAIKSCEDNFGGPLSQTSFFQQSSERRPGPLSSPNCLKQPRLADVPGREKSTAIASTLHGDGKCLGWSLLDLVQSQTQGFRDHASDLETPIADIDLWNVIVDQQIVHTRWRNRIAQSLQRHSSIAGGELKLFFVEIIRLRESAAVANNRELSCGVLFCHHRLLGMNYLSRFNSSVSPQLTVTKSASIPT